MSGGPTPERARGRRWHFIILGILATGPLGFGVYLIVLADGSGSGYSGIATALGLALAGAALGYAVITTTAVFIAARRPRDAVLVHASALLLGLIIAMFSRLSLFG